MSRVPHALPPRNWLRSATYSRALHIHVPLTLLCPVHRNRLAGSAKPFRVAVARYSSEHPQGQKARPQTADLASPPYSGRNVAFEAPHVHYSGSLPANVVIPQSKPPSPPYTAQIPLLPDQSSSTNPNESSFVLHAPRVVVGDRHFDSYASTHMASPEAPSPGTSPFSPEDASSAPGIPRKNGNGASEAKVSSLWESLLDQILPAASGQPEPSSAAAWAPEWKFDDRPLNAEERKGLWTLGGIVVFGYFLGTILSPSTSKANTQNTPEYSSTTHEH